jgi:hypothetical protein
MASASSERHKIAAASGGATPAICRADISRSVVPAKAGIHREASDAQQDLLRRFRFFGNRFAA